MLTLYGISNCDSCRKARKWLRDHSLEHDYHDLRLDGVDIQMLERWSSIVDWQNLINKGRRTWRQIPEAERQGINRNRALALMLKYPTLIKRPVVESDEFLAVGFSETRYRQILWRAG